MINSFSSSRGFTLVEMSVVLVIIGLLMTAAISFGTSQITLNRIAATKTKEDAIKNALISFIARTNRLPCPAVPTLSLGAVGYGVEDCVNTPSNGTVRSGIIPWVSIGLSNEGATDGYYNRFSYQVSVAAVALNTNTISGLTGNNRIYTGTPTGAGNQINDCSNGLTVNPCAAVVVILSHGTNGLGSYNSDGIRQNMPAGSDEAENTNGDENVVIRDFSDNSANPYDDIVVAYTPTDLLSPLTNYGSIKRAQAKVADQMQTILGSISTYALSMRSLGTPGSRSYPLIVSGASPNELSTLNLSDDVTIDPWGTPIHYTHGLITSITPTTPDADTAITLTSNGMDKVLGTSDDISISVSYGVMKAIFSTYGW